MNEGPLVVQWLVSVSPLLIDQFLQYFQYNRSIPAIVNTVGQFLLYFHLSDHGITLVSCEKISF